MAHRRIIPILLIFSFLLSVVFVAQVSAQTEADVQVDATITCTYVTGTSILLHAQMIVNSITVFDTTYDRTTIESIAASNPIVMGGIMSHLYDSVKNQLEMSFTSADVSSVTKIPTYEKPYFVSDFRVNLTAAFFKYNHSLNFSSFVNGVLDMGATVSYGFNLLSEEGWNTSYVFMLPGSMSMVSANTDQTSPLQWSIDNWDGTHSQTDASLFLKLTNPSTPVSDTQDISLTLAVDTSNIQSVDFTDTIVVKSLQVGQHIRLPGFITGLTVIPADGIRLFIENGLFSWADLFSTTIQPILNSTLSVIENSSLNQHLDVVFSWDPQTTTNCSTPYNMSHMDDIPAVQAQFRDPDIDLLICQMPARAFFGLINAGASASIVATDMNFGSGLQGISYPYTLMLSLPYNITLDGKNIITWNASTPLSGSFGSGLAPAPYSSEHVETYVEIDLSKMDLNIFSLFSGKTQLTASTKMKEDESLYVIRWPSVFSHSSTLNLAYLNADAFRLCAEEQVFTPDQVTDFLSEKKDMFQQRLSAVLHGLPVTGMVDRKVFSDSLQWDKDISAMDDVVPVVTSSYASAMYSVGFNMSLWPVSLSFAPQQFSLQGLDGQKVVYRIIFPKGITVNCSDSLGKISLSGALNDGREYVEVSFDEGALNQSMNQSTVLTCVMNASPVYVLGMFLPCILVFLLLIILVVIIFVIRKKRGGLRRGKGKIFEPDDDEPTDYASQEYYVPPPPSSKKKK
jgi:hypothetical protein